MIQNAFQNHPKTEPQSKKLSSEWWCQWLINKIPLRLTFANQVFSWIPPPPPPAYPSNPSPSKYSRPEIQKENRGLLLLLLVHGGWMYPEPAPRQQHFTWHQPCNNQPQSATRTPFLWILIIRTKKGYSHSFRITCDVHRVRLRAVTSTM